MATIMRGSQAGDAPAIDGAAEPFTLSLDLEIRDPDTIAELLNYAAGRPRDQFALHALRIGVLALRQARGQLDANLIQHETKRMLQGMETQLGEHARLVQDRLATALKEYFDPESGRFSERVKRLVEKDGDLERVLQSQISGQDSELCKTLLAHVGQNSPLMKMLSPSDSQGLLSTLRETVADQLRVQRERVLSEFSLDNKEGALARLVDELNAKNGELGGQIQHKIDAVVKEFSLDEENSALSRLVKNVQSAQETISAQFSLDNEASAFSRLKQTLESTSQAIHDNLTLDEEQSSLSRLKRHLETILGALCETNAKFQEEVKVALAQMLAKREEAARSTRHGIEFEEVVCQFLELESQRSGDIAQRTGDKTGLIRNRKFGDCVIELGPDSPAPGGKIVVEAKEEVNYSLPAARQEIENARKNRDAQFGLFVFSQKTAPQGLERFSRLGNDVFVVWDAEDAMSDVYLKAGLSTARGLCICAGRESAAQAADFNAIDAAILEIEKRSNALEDISKLTETIRSHSDKIIEHVRKARNALERQVETLREKIVDLKQIGS